MYFVVKIDDIDKGMKRIHKRTRAQAFPNLLVGIFGRQGQVINSKSRMKVIDYAPGIEFGATSFLREPFDRLTDQIGTKAELALYAHLYGGRADLIEDLKDIGETLVGEGKDAITRGGHVVTGLLRDSVMFTVQDTERSGIENPAAGPRFDPGLK